jgi:hypothetical protein
MGATRRERTGRSSEFADVLELIETINVSADTNLLTFADLDGNADDRYFMEFDLLTGASLITVRPNGLTTNLTSNGTYVVPTAGGSINFFQDTLIDLLVGAGGIEVISGKIEIYARSGKKRFFRVTASAFQGAPDNRSIMGETVGMWDDTTTNLTSIIITTNSGGNGILAGSTFSLYRLKS